jgi:hypothetical protein
MFADQHHELNDMSFVNIAIESLHHLLRHDDPIETTDDQSTHHSLNLGHSADQIARLDGPYIFNARQIILDFLNEHVAVGMTHSSSTSFSTACSVFAGLLVAAIAVRLQTMEKLSLESGNGTLVSIHSICMVEIPSNRMFLSLWHRKTFPFRQQALCLDRD